MSARVWWRRPLDRSFLMIGGLAALAGLGQWLTPPAPPTQQTVVVPISSLALVCPALPADSDGFEVIAKGAVTDGRGSARVEVQTARRSFGPIRDAEVRVTGIRRSGTVVYTAEGTSAPKLVADASIVGTTRATRGYATYACQPPSTSQWLVGGGSTSGRTSVLSIANVEGTPATIDVEAWTELGKSGSRLLTGVEIPPYSRRQVTLAQLEPGRRMFALHVTATSGQVTSAIFDRAQQALVSVGADVVSAVSAPLASSVVGVLPNGSTGAVLGVLSPGTATSVRVALITSDGTYSLAGAENLAIDGDKLTLIPIPDDALTGDVAVQVQADSPVIAGVQSKVYLRGGNDLASAPMLAPLYRVASVTVDATVSLATALLYADVDTVVDISVRTGSRIERSAITVRAGQVRRVKLLGGQGETHVVSIEPQVDGMLRGAVLLQRGSAGMVASSVEPLMSLRGYVTVPPVAPATSR